MRETVLKTWQDPDKIPLLSLGRNGKQAIKIPTFPIYDPIPEENGTHESVQVDTVEEIKENQ